MDIVYALRSRNPEYIIKFTANEYSSFSFSPLWRKYKSSFDADIVKFVLICRKKTRVTRRLRYDDQQ